jgi:hypothetical protein
MGIGENGQDEALKKKKNRVVRRPGHLYHKFETSPGKVNETLTQKDK